MAVSNPHSVISSEESFLLSIFHSFWRNRCVSVIVGLKIPDLICSSQESSMSIDEIAAKSGCDSTKQLYPIMRLAAQWGIGRELDNKHFAKNRALELLRRDQGPSIGHMFEYYMGDELFLGYRSLAACVKHGTKSPFVIEHGMSHYQYMYDIENSPYCTNKLYEGASKYKIGSDERRRELADVYEKAMKKKDGKGAVEKLFKAFPWSECKRIVDIGGSTGEFLASILKLPGCENIQGYVLELPDVVDDAKRKILDLGISEHRIQFIKQDVFQPFPSGLRLGADTVITKAFLCQYTSDEEKMTKFFSKCRALFPAEGGRLLIIDYIVPDGGEGGLSGSNDLYMGDARSVHLFNIFGKCHLSKKDWCERFAESGINEMGYNLHKIHGTLNGGQSLCIFELHYTSI